MKTKHIAGAGIGLLTLVGQAGAETVGHEKYTYDAAGNIVEKRIDDQVTRFEYEGNLLKSDNQGTHYRHDRAGRLTGESREGSVERKLTYQFGDKITRVEKGNTTTELFYNAEGHLVGKSGGDRTEAFAWDRLGLAMWGGQAYVNEDHIVGGVPALVDGKVSVPDPLGSSLSIGERSLKATAFGEGLEAGLFTGKPYVQELNSFVFKYRNYSADNLRWNSIDPAGFPDGKNNFMYAMGDPLARFDPLGLSFFHYTEGQLQYRDGVGYQTKTENGVTLGDVDMGDLTVAYAAVSNNDPQDELNGRAPNGWYALGTTEDTLGFVSERDTEDSGTWTQGSMSKWGHNDPVEEFTDTTATNAEYHDENFHVTQWKIHYGDNFDSSKLAPNQPDPFDKYAPPRTYPDLRVHPDGRNSGTNGCIGISTYVDSHAFIENLDTYGGEQLLIPEQ